MRRKLLCAVACIGLVAQAAPQPQVRPQAEVFVPAQGCGAVAMYLYMKAVGVDVDYAACARELGESGAGVSVAEMESAAAALGSPLVGRSVSRRELEGVRVPLIMLTPPRYSQRGPGGAMTPIGHYVAVLPTGERDWIILDFPAAKPHRVDTVELWKAIGIDESSRAVVLGSAKPAGGAGDAPLSAYMAQPTTVPSRSVAESVHDAGFADCPFGEPRTEHLVDLSARWAGEHTPLRVLIRNVSSRPILLRSGEASCSCMKLSAPESVIPPGQSAECFGAITTAVGMDRKPEWSDLIATYADDGSHAGSLRLVIRADVRLPVIVEPSTVAFGRLSPFDAAEPILVRITHVRGEELELVGSSDPAFEAKLVRRSGSQATIEVWPKVPASALGYRRAGIHLATASPESTRIEVPVEATFLAPIELSPQVAVLDQTSGPVLVRARTVGDGEIQTQRVEGLVGVGAVVGPDGAIEFRRLVGAEAPRIQRATVFARVPSRNETLQADLIVIVR
jgi:hypothetical protein